MLKDSLKRNGNFPLSYEPDMIMSGKSPFAQAFDKFAGKKKLDQCIMTQNFYVKPQDIRNGFDSVKKKGDSIQYVPIFETLNVILLQTVNPSMQIWKFLSHLKMQMFQRKSFISV